MNIIDSNVLMLKWAGTWKIVNFFFFFKLIKSFQKCITWCFVFMFKFYHDQIWIVGTTYPTWWYFSNLFFLKKKSKSKFHSQVGTLCIIGIAYSNIMLTVDSHGSLGRRMTSTCRSMTAIGHSMTSPGKRHPWKSKTLHIRYLHSSQHWK